jgi:hypothetical protein
MSIVTAWRTFCSLFSTDLIMSGYQEAENQRLHFYYLPDAVVGAITTCPRHLKTSPDHLAPDRSDHQRNR